MKGKKVAITSPAGSGESAVAYLLKQGGLTIKDVDILFLPYRDMVTALTNKGLDVADMTEPTLSTVVERGLAVTWPQGPRPI